MKCFSGRLKTKINFNFKSINKTLASMYSKEYEVKTTKGGPTTGKSRSLDHRRKEEAQSGLTITTNTCRTGQMLHTKNLGAREGARARVRGTTSTKITVIT